MMMSFDDSEYIQLIKAMLALSPKYFQVIMDETLWECGNCGAVPPNRLYFPVLNPEFISYECFECASDGCMIDLNKSSKVYIGRRRFF